MGSLAWDLLYGISCMGSRAWDLVHGISCMGSCAWDLVHGTLYMHYYALNYCALGLVHGQMPDNKVSSKLSSL